MFINAVFYALGGLFDPRRMRMILVRPDSIFKIVKVELSFEINESLSLRSWQ